jgi:hypothetical protein
MAAPVRGWHVEGPVSTRAGDARLFHCGFHPQHVHQTTDRGKKGALFLVLRELFVNHAEEARHYFELAR